LDAFIFTCWAITRSDIDLFFSLLLLLLLLLLLSSFNGELFDSMIFIFDGIEGGGGLGGNPDGIGGGGGNLVVSFPN